jgi:hypothetical protein
MRAVVFLTVIVLRLRFGEGKGNIVAKVTEHVQAAHDEVRNVQMGKAYKWHPKSPVVECGCGRMLSTSGSTTSCSECGSDHTDPLRNESVEGYQSDESLHPWRYSEDHKAKEGLPDLGLPFLVLPF